MPTGCRLDHAGPPGADRIVRIDVVEVAGAGQEVVTDSGGYPGWKRSKSSNSPAQLARQRRQQHRADRDQGQHGQRAGTSSGEHGRHGEHAGADDAADRQDVVALGPDGDRGESLLAIGEVKWHEAMGIPHLERLRQIRGLLTAQHRHGAATARLLCFSGGGFTAELTREVSRCGDVRLVTPADLYAGVLLLSAAGRALGT